MLLFGIYVLCETPLVIGVAEPFIPRLKAVLPSRLDPYLLVFPTHTKEPWRFAAKSWWRLRALNWHRLRWMCCTEKEVRRLSTVGFNAVWCHQNLFCNEDNFKVCDRPKRWDAVYTSQIHPIKRLHLASKVRSLRVVTASHDRVDQLKQYGVGHADVNHRYLSSQEVALALAECRVGLALSAREGGMLACTEYLLCGLPVVSTPSIGGRDEWFESDNHVLCPSTPEGVAAAVDKGIQVNFDAHQIRDKALARSRHFRAVLADEVASISGRRPFDAEGVTGSWFTQHFVPIESLSLFLQSHNGSAFERTDLLGKFG